MVAYLKVNSERVGWPLGRSEYHVFKVISLSKTVIKLKLETIKLRISRLNCKLVVNLVVMEKIKMMVEWVKIYQVKAESVGHSLRVIWRITIKTTICSQMASFLVRKSRRNLRDS